MYSGSSKIYAERSPAWWTPAGWWSTACLRGTLAALPQQLRRQDYHIFHYVGHGL